MILIELAAIELCLLNVWLLTAVCTLCKPNLIANVTACELIRNELERRELHINIHVKNVALNGDDDDVGDVNEAIIEMSHSH